MPNFPESNNRIVTIGDADFHEWNTNDVGTPTPGNLADIQPITDGETANQTTFRRPPNNLRERSEFVKTFLRDLAVNIDMDRLMAINVVGGEFLWEGPQNPTDPTDPDLGTIYLDTPGSYLQIIHANWPDSPIQIDYTALQNYYDTTKIGASPIFLHSYNLREGDTLYCIIPRTFNETTGRISKTYNVPSTDIFKIPLNRGIYSGAISGAGVVPGNTIRIYNNLPGDPLNVAGWTALTYDIPVTEVPIDFPNTLITAHDECPPIKGVGYRFSVGTIVPYDNIIPLTPGASAVPDYRFRNYKLSSLFGIDDPEDMPIMIPIATIQGGRAILINGAELKATQSYPNDWPPDVSGVEADIFNKLSDDTKPPTPDLDPEGSSYIGCDLIDDKGIEWLDAIATHNSCTLTESFQKINQALIDRNFPGCKGLLSGFDNLSFNPVGNLFEFTNDADQDVVFWADGYVIRHTDGDNPLDMSEAATSAPNEWRWLVWDTINMQFAHKITTGLTAPDIPLTYYHLDGADNVDEWYDVRLWVGRGEQALNKSGFNTNIIPGIFSVGGDPSNDFSNHYNFGNFRNFNNAMDYFYVLDILMTGPGDNFYWSTLNILSDITLTTLKGGGASPWQYPNGLKLVGAGGGTTIHNNAAGPMFSFEGSTFRNVIWENITWDRGASINMFTIDITTSDMTPMFFNKCHFTSTTVTNVSYLNIDGANTVEGLFFTDCTISNIRNFILGDIPATCTLHTYFTNCVIQNVDNIANYILTAYLTLNGCYFDQCADTDSFRCFIGATVGTTFGGRVTITDSHGSIRRIFGSNTGELHLNNCSLTSRDDDFIEAGKVKIINCSLINASGTIVQTDPYIKVYLADNVISNSYIASNYNDELINANNTSNFILKNCNLHYAYIGLKLEKTFGAAVVSSVVIDGNMFSKDIITAIGQGEKAAIDIGDISGTLYDVSGVTITNNFFTTTVTDTTADRSCAVRLYITKFVISNNFVIPNPATDTEYLGIGINIYNGCPEGFIGHNHIWTDYEQITQGGGIISSVNISHNQLISNDATTYKINLVQLRQSIIDNNNLTPSDTTMNGGGINITTGSALHISNNYIEDADLESITGDLSTSMITDNFIFNPQDVAIEMLDTLGRYIISNNLIRGSSIAASITMIGCDDSIITDNIIYQDTATSTAIGIDITITSGVQHSIISNNYINAYTGISIEGSIIEYITILNNLIEASRCIELRLTGTSYARYLDIKTNTLNVIDNAANDEVGISLNEGGVLTSTWDSINIQNNFVHAPAREAIYCYGCDDIQIRDNQINNCWMGIIVSECSQGSITGNVVTHSSLEAIEITSVTEGGIWQINNNYIEFCALGGIYVTITAGFSTIQMNGNFINSRGNDSIHINGTTQCSVTNNYIYFANSGPSNAIYMISAGYVSVIGNTIVNGPSGNCLRAINLASVLAIVMGNFVDECTQYAIQFQANVNGNIIGNTCMGCTQAASSVIRLLGARNLAIGNYVTTLSGQAYGIYVSDPTGLASDQIAVHNYVYVHTGSTGAHNITNTPQADNLVTAVDGQDTPNWSSSYT